ncbi:MAG TPA: BPL-N domain-containing protein [Capsulimonadaceae bacterium]|jgi:hypothetical protein
MKYLNKFAALAVVVAILLSHSLIAAPADSASPPATVDLSVPALTPVASHAPLKLALYEGPGSIGGDHHALVNAAFVADPNVTLAVLSPADIQSGKLSDYDVLVQAGGSGGAQGKALGPTGRDAIRAFVKAGGGYIGICGGSYLASANYDWSLNIINTKVVDREHWARGHGEVKIGLSDDGKKLLGVDSGTLPILYWQGPLMAPKNDPTLPSYTELAKFDTEIAENGAPKGVMTGTTAIAAAPFGEGRVVCFSPHPEKVTGEASLLNHAVVWAAAAKLAPKKAAAN